ncbi:PTS sugar transporter subunit IIA [Kroppenstedtia eburnea]|uniref:Mannitol-specific phosphotransferase enzyme IIA component n=1 Tax=Kroppenstedtia eburnea TaxID=714067 RepID=A0A1N7NRC2_9BACL|nr:PTS sugar transporter subunit IIA [Kroppenstedtia eburnea]QKI81122.1 PTS sugar transporter subunit IIA [Kroppenstedtia eburnea]SIT00856.1 PTS system D-mannitol-specific IIA component, Fru family [Kroppenstedtia eburnea]
MSHSILTEETVLLNADAKNKEEAIRLAGQLLVDQGCVEPSYIERMLEREQSLTTYIGNSVAIPHGTEEGKKNILRSGISILQIPGGVDFGDGQTAKILIGIAGKGDEHMEILSKIALVCAEEESVDKMVHAQSKEELLSLFDEVN